MTSWEQDGVSSGTKASIASQLPGHVLTPNGKDGWRSWHVSQPALCTSTPLHSPPQDGLGMSQKPGSQGQQPLLAPAMYTGLQLKLRGIQGPGLSPLNCVGKELGERGGETYGPDQPGSPWTTSQANTGNDSTNLVPPGSQQDTGTHTSLSPLFGAPLFSCCNIHQRSLC